MKIAILGTRGVPANYGGFETFAEALSVGLVRRGHRVTVYARNHYVKAGREIYRGVRILRLPSLRSKHLETVSHTALSVLHALTCRYDVLLVCNAANAFLCALPRLAGQGVVLNVDGIERLRAKWGWWGKGFYRLGEILATRFPHRVVADARTIARYYQERYGCHPVFIPYGAPVGKLNSQGTLQRLGLRPRQYLLYVSRLEPENNAHRVLQAYLDSGISLPLALVGDAPYSRRYISLLREQAARGSVLMPGGIYGEAYRELLSHCLCYIQATEVGGTHPALVEAMGAGCLVIANDTPEHREVLADCGLYYRFNDAGSLRRRLQQVVARPEDYAFLGRRAQERVSQTYNWERVISAYEELFLSLAAQAGDGPASRLW